MEEEAREILRSAVNRTGPEEDSLAEAIRRKFAALGGVELQIPKREPIREPPDFSK